MVDTDRATLISKLKRGGHDALVAAVEAGAVSAYAAACEALIVRRRPVLGSGSLNQTKRRNWRMSQVTGRPPPDVEPEPEINPPRRRPARRDVLDIGTKPVTKPQPAEPPKPKEWTFDPKAIIA